MLISSIFKFSFNANIILCDVHINEDSEHLKYFSLVTFYWNYCLQLTNKYETSYFAIFVIPSENQLSELICSF